jgi:hypothetical protein
MVLPQVPIAGLTEAAPGPMNGPIGPSNIDLFGGTDGLVAQHIANGDMNGYIRLVAHSPANGESAVIEGTWIKDPSSIPGFIAGVEGAAKGTQFAVPGIDDAIGISSTNAISGVQTYTIAFSRGNYVFVTLVDSLKGSLGEASAISVASAQAAAVSGMATTGGASSTAYRTCEIFGAVLLAALILGGLVIAIRRSSGPKDKVARGSGAVIWAAPIASTPSTIGWHQIGKGFNNESYWDGRSWTANRQWRPGVGWTESPLNQTSS